MRSLNPFPQYLEKFTQRGFSPDPAQLLALEALALVHEKLVLSHHKKHLKLKKMLGLRPSSVKGLYFWGGVGRGKTLLMDIFFEQLPFKAKQRFHFHAFMRRVHQELKQLEGLKNPLTAIAKNITKQTQILCFDEFHVDDVADAMILGELFKTLFHEGLTIIFTSNTAPDQLYKNGVQRHLFLPVINLIKDKTTVMEIDQGQDYRKQALMEAGVYFSPLTDTHQQIIEHKFLQIATGDILYGHSVSIESRDIPTLALAHRLIWFDFKSICQTYRSAEDYLSLTAQFDTFFITRVPVLLEADNPPAKRFIHLIDVLYDHRAKLIISAAALPAELYQGKSLAKEFQRTISRLIEMQGHDYMQ